MEWDELLLLCFVKSGLASVVVFLVESCLVVVAVVGVAVVGEVAVVEGFSLIVVITSDVIISAGSVSEKLVVVVGGLSKNLAKPWA